MSRKAKPPRLLLEDRGGNREAYWLIVDRGRKIRTGCSRDDIEGAGRALEAYLASRRKIGEESDPTRLLVADILNFYMIEHVKTLARPDVPLYRIKYLLQWWDQKRASDIKPKACRDYIEWRMKQIGVRGPIQEGTARKDLETLRAALRFYHEEQPLASLPVVKLPKKPGRREEWLTRNQAAALIWAAWRNPDAKHLVRFALIIFYSGTRPGAVLKLKWCASNQGGWIDLDHNKLYRRGENEQETRKKRTPAPIHRRLIPHLHRWRKLDRQIGMEYVIHHNGRPVTKLRRSWRTACKGAGLSEKIVPHTGRHTAATWLMQAGVSPWEAAGYLGMSVDTLIKHYGHHSPDYQEQAACAVAPKQRKSRTPGESVAR